LSIGNRSHFTPSSRHDVGMEIAAPPWSLRPAAYDDGGRLAAIVAEAARDQGSWPDMTPAEEAEWHEGFARWSRESVDGPDTLQIVELEGEPVGRLRTERDHVVIDGRRRRRITVCGIQLRPAVQGRGIGTAIIRDLQAEAASSQGVVDLGVEHANTHARRLYERLGFVPFARDEQELHLRWCSSAAQA
jgi:ribosomal protein S18 acetylase RimI-like enzyme